jgi:hypothetical protein
MTARTLVIVPSRAMAQAAGCDRVTSRHRASGDIRFWWPSQGEAGLIGREWKTIVLAAKLTAAELEPVRVYAMRNDPAVVNIMGVL